MWRFKSFMPKESAGLEGRTIDVGNVKVQVRNTIAEGGFSCVYVARDVVSSKQYALKHMICNDGESLDLVMKEISVMKLLKGHPNIVTLVAHSIADMGRTKEAFLVMEFCDKSLVAVLDKREAGYFDEKQVLLIFRDVCNAVFAMHCQSPPIAHRDLKAENVLLGADGAWKLCDFGSTSTNHKCFDKPEEMGIEEDNIRKHTTPSYRAPEMWDLFRREVITEKVDIWALGCLLYRICYLKLAFDGESKLQILNGNYRIPELPKYSPAVMGLIKDMLEGSPDVRPDITQVWFRVNEQLPVELQKHLPEGIASAVDTRHPTPVLHDEGVSKTSPPMPQKSPPPPPSATEQVWNILPQSEKDGQRLKSSQATSKPGPIGAFWSTQHARDTIVEDKGPLFDEEPTNQMKSKHNQNNLDKRSSPQRELHSRPGEVPKNVHINSPNEPTSGDFEISFFPEDSQHSSDKNKAQHFEDKASFQNKAFNTFMAEFDSSKLKSRTITSNALNNRSGKKELEAEVEKLKEQLRQANLEKAEITSKYEKLSAICRSQRQEIQELKRAISAATPPPPIKEHSKNEISPGNSHSSTPPREKIEGTVWEQRQGMIGSGSASLRPEPKSWQMFTESSKAQPTATNNYPKLVRTTNGHKNTTKQSTMGIVNENIWGFEDSFTATPASSQISSSPAVGSTSQRFVGSETKKIETSQPAGWAGF